MGKKREAQKRKGVERAMEMEVMRESGYTLQEIGDRYGVTRERVRQVIGNTGNRATEWLKEKIDRYPAWMSNREVAKMAGIGYGTVVSLREIGHDEHREALFYHLQEENGDGCRVIKLDGDCNGYPRYGYGGVVDYAHRIAWRFENGEIPEGAWVMHSCGNKRCMNVEHMYIMERG